MVVEGTCAEDPRRRRVLSQTSLAISFTRASLAHCSSSVSLLPISHEAKPHGGAQVEAVERYVAGGFVDARDHGVLVFQLGALGGDQAERMELGYLYRPERPLTPLAQRYLELMKADVAPWRDEPAAAR